MIKQLIVCDRCEAVCNKEYIDFRSEGIKRTNGVTSPGVRTCVELCPGCYLFIRKELTGKGGKP